MLVLMFYYSLYLLRLFSLLYASLAFSRPSVKFPFIFAMALSSINLLISFSYTLNYSSCPPSIFLVKSIFVFVCKKGFSFCFGVYPNLAALNDVIGLFSGYYYLIAVGIG